MKLPKNDETDLDSEAARRALDYYLNPNPPRPTLDNRIWTLHEGVTGEQAKEHAIALLRCAAATAQETCEDVICLALSEMKREEAGRKGKTQERRGLEE
jgi:hypothetical protein